MAGAIRLINSLLYGKNESILSIHQEFAYNFLKNYFSRNQSKTIFPRYSVDFHFFQKFSEKSPKIFRKIVTQAFYQKHFPEFHNFSKFSENFETTLVNVHLSVV